MVEEDAFGFGDGVRFHLLLHSIVQDTQRMHPPVEHKQSSSCDLLFFT